MGVQQPEAGAVVNWFKYSSPQSFFPLAGKLAFWFGALALVVCAAGLYIGFFRAPTDAQQGEAYRIIFIHVPAAWMSMFLYLVMAFWAGLGLAFNTRLSGMMASAIAPTGALFTFLALWTGSLWGKPMWGTWWIWDARLTSELILFFLYMAAIALRAAYGERQQTPQIISILVLVGFLDIPIIHYSVNWWNTLHQGATLSQFAVPSIAPSMLYPLLTMLLAFFSYFFSQLFRRARSAVLFSERRTEWVKQIVQ